MLGLGVRVKSIVSDRAKALVSLGNSTYLDVVSMPDLFHFVQDISRSFGSHIGRKTEQAHKAMESACEATKAALRTAYEELVALRKSYRQQIEGINKSVHPFDENDKWTTQAEVEKNLLHCFTKIGQLAKTIDLEVDVAKGMKMLSQITPIAEGVEQWIDQTKTKLEQWTESGVLNNIERVWLEQYALPYKYWEKQVDKTQAKSRNKDLRQYYKNRMNTAIQNSLFDDIGAAIPHSRKEELWKMAHSLAISFQRASSQVEGRNGYLSFVNHAHKGIPEQRLKALTIIHNYDIRRKDGTTPAKRFFDAEFPDLFEFLCLNVTGFKEPRKRKAKLLNMSSCPTLDG